jgi:hypothetical protein
MCFLALEDDFLAFLKLIGDFPSRNGRNRDMILSQTKLLFLAVQAPNT